MKISLKKLCLFAGAIFGFIAFAMCFLTAVTITSSGLLGTTVESVAWNKVYFNSELTIFDTSLTEIGGTILPFIGFILILLGAIALMLLAFKKLPKRKKKCNNLWKLILVFPILAGVVLVALTKATWLSTNSDNSIFTLIINQDNLSLGIGPILGIAFGSLSFIVGAYGIILKK